MVEEQHASTVAVAGKAVSDIVNGLKGSPLILALIVLQVITFLGVLYSSVHRQAAISEQISSLHRLLEACMNRNG